MLICLFDKQLRNVYYSLRTVALEVQNMFPDLEMHIGNMENLSPKWNAQHVQGTVLAIKAEFLGAAKAL